MSSNPFWDDFGKGSKKSGGKIVNLKLEARDEPYRLRLIGDPQEYYKLFYNGKSVVLQSNNSPLVDRYNSGKNLSAKYACLVIDRDDALLKIVEVPANPLKPLMAWRKLKKRDPGGDNGCDWGIDVTGQGKDKRYQGLALDDSPLTAEEKAAIEAANIDVAKLYRALSDEDAEARLLGKEVSGGASTQQSAPARPATNAVGAQTTISKDVPF